VTIFSGWSLNYLKTLLSSVFSTPYYFAGCTLYSKGEWSTRLHLFVRNISAYWCLSFVAITMYPASFYPGEWVTATVVDRWRSRQSICLVLPILRPTSDSSRIRARVWIFHFSSFIILHHARKVWGQYPNRNLRSFLHRHSVKQTWRSCKCKYIDEVHNFVFVAKVSRQAGSPKPCCFTP